MAFPISLENGSSTSSIHLVCSLNSPFLKLFSFFWTFQIQAYSSASFVQSSCRSEWSFWGRRVSSRLKLQNLCFHSQSPNLQEDKEKCFNIPLTFILVFFNKKCEWIIGDYLQRERGARCWWDELRYIIFNYSYCHQYKELIHEGFESSYNISRQDSKELTGFECIMNLFHLWIFPVPVSLQSLTHFIIQNIAIVPAEVPAPGC